MPDDYQPSPQHAILGAQLAMSDYDQLFRNLRARRDAELAKQKQAEEARTQALTLACQEMETLILDVVVPELNRAKTAAEELDFTWDVEVSEKEFTRGLRRYKATAGLVGEGARIVFEGDPVRKAFKVTHLSVPQKLLEDLSYHTIAFADLSEKTVKERVIQFLERVLV